MSDPLPSQLGPFEVNAETGEPYLRLPTPLSHIVITPPRLSDAPFAYALLNDPRIYRWISTPPWPYLMVHAVDWLQKVKTETDEVWKELQEAATENPDGPLKFVAASPVRIIRHQKEDDTEVFLGDCGFSRATYREISDLEERARLLEENNARPAGDPDIIWTMGDYLDPAYHGQGIMTAAIGTLMSKWAIPRMAVRCVRPSAFDGNGGSLRTFEKNGFVMWKTLKNSMFIKAKGEFPAEMRTMHFMEWKADP